MLLDFEAHRACLLTTIFLQATPLSLCFSTWIKREANMCLVKLFKKKNKKQFFVFLSTLKKNANVCWKDYMTENTMFTKVWVSSACFDTASVKNRLPTYPLRSVTLTRFHFLHFGWKQKHWVEWPRPPLFLLWSPQRHGNSSLWHKFHRRGCVESRTWRSDAQSSQNVLQISFLPEHFKKWTYYKSQTYSLGTF